MKPYYQDKSVMIYNADCREVLPSLAKADLVLTDPAYGIKADRDRNCRVNGWRDYGSTGWDNDRTSPEIIRLILGAGSNSIIWGGNYFTDTLPVSMGWLAWDKGQTDFSLADFELAWTSFQCAARRFVFSRAAALKDGKQHPTQKPIALMQWCIQFADARLGSDNKIILDPLCGSGTTLRAAKDMGRDAIGIDREERYCEIAAKRMAQEVFEFA